MALTSIPVNYAEVTTEAIIEAFVDNLECGDIEITDVLKIVRQDQMLLRFQEIFNTAVVNFYLLDEDLEKLSGVTLMRIVGVAKKILSPDDFQEALTLSLPVKGE